MIHSKRSLACLFSRLGIDSSSANIDKFINDNTGIPADIALAEATAYGATQTEFLQQILSDKSDWSEVIRGLNLLLR